MVFTRLINLTTFTLEEFSIGSMPPYLAASHVWAENLFPVSAIASIGTTQGIRLILSALRSYSRGTPQITPGYCWVDTWCIDQSSQDDKMHQMPRMGDIYRDAEFVVATVLHSFTFTQGDWETALTTCKIVTDLQNVPPSKRFSSLYVKDLNPLTAQAILRAGAMLLEIATLRWAGRIWTAQEYILAKFVIWIGIDELTVRLQVMDIYHVLWTQHELGVLLLNSFEEPVDRVALSDTEQIALDNWRLLVGVKKNSNNRSRAMLLAQWRQSTIPSDAVYGLMGVSGATIDPIVGESLEMAWSRWWEASVTTGNLYYALMSVLGPNQADISSGFWDCIMPSCEQRFESVKGYYPNREKSLGAVHVKDGTLSVLGRNIGICHIEKFLYIGTIPDTVEELSKICGHDDDLALRICLVHDNDIRSQAEVRNMAKAICAYWKLHNYSGCLTRQREVDLEALIDMFEAPKMIYDCHTKVYLSRIASDLTTTDTLVFTGEELQADANLIALDLLEHPDGIHYLSNIMIAQVPDDPSRPLHKVGMTLPMLFHKADCDLDLCKIIAHKDPGVVERFEIGGSACEICTERKKQFEEEGTRL